MLQIDVNVARPISDRMTKLYSSDSINHITVRLYFKEEDKNVVMQLLNDKRITAAIWNPEPVEARL